MDAHRPVHARMNTEASNPAPAWRSRLLGHPGILLAFLWGFAEGTLFFVVPDVLISLAALLCPRRAGRHVAASIVGAVIGGALLYTWSVHDPQSASAAVAHVPFVKPRIIAAARQNYLDHGLGAVFIGPLTATPYKIYAIQAPEYVREPVFLLATIPARGERFVFVWLAFAAIGILLRRLPTTTDANLTLGCVIFWIIFYSIYWTRIMLR